MATRPTEADEHWTARQRLRKARRQEVAQLYEQRVVPTLASGCHIPGRDPGAPPVAHNSSKEAINYCGQVLEGPRPMIERLLRGDYYTASGGGVGPGEGAKAEGKSFRCRAQQPLPGDPAPTPLVSDAVPPGSIRSACGGRLIYDHKQRNLGLPAHDLPLKPLVDPLPMQPRSARTASARGSRPGTNRGQPPAPLMAWGEDAAAASAPSPTYSHAVQTDEDLLLMGAGASISPRGVLMREASVGSEHRTVTDAAVGDDCGLALAESSRKKKPHHCHHRHPYDPTLPHGQQHHHHHGHHHHHSHRSHSADKAPRHADPFGAVGAPLPTTAQVRSIPLNSPAAAAASAQAKQQQQHGRAGQAGAAAAVPGYQARTLSSKTKEAQVVVEKGPHYHQHQQQQRPSTQPHVAVRNAYENALQVAKEKVPGVTAVISANEMSKIRELAHKPPTPRLHAPSFKPKDSENILQ